MWITKDSQIALFKVNILSERRWSIQGRNVQLITEAELVEPSLIFAVVYHLPKKLENKTFDSNTPPILHVYGKHIKLGFHTHFNLLQHDYSLQHDHLDIHISTSTPKIFIPVCGVAQQLQFCFTNITNKPSFNKQTNNEHYNEDFGIIEIYGYSLQQIPASRAAIPMLNLSTFFQYKSQEFLNKNDSYNAQNDYKLLMTAAECDTMCAYISIQSRYFNQAKELLTRAKDSWLKLYHSVMGNEQINERNSFFRQIRGKCDRFKYNALRLDTLIAYSMNEHNDYKTQIKSILNIIDHHTPISAESSERLLPLQIISKYSKSLITTLLLTSLDSNEFVQMASFKNIYFIIEKLGCNIKHDICDILCSIFEFDSNKSVSEDKCKLQSKPLHIQSIIRQIISIKHNICDAALNLISDCNFQIVTQIFEKLIIRNFKKIMKLESTKLAYCLRIFELCIERLHSAPTITVHILTSMIGLIYHPSKRVRNISISIWTSFLFILPTQILRQNTEICEWLCHMITNTDMNRVYNDNMMLIEMPIIIIKKMCEIQISWNANDNKSGENGLLMIASDINKLCICLKDRILQLLMDSIYFDQFRLLLQSLDFLSCSIKDYGVFDELTMRVLSRFLSHLKASSPSLMMLKVCVEFMEYITMDNNDEIIDITLQILREFHEWIPHSIHDETFVLAKKLIDINYTFLSHSDFCLIVQSLLSKYTLRSAVFQEFQHKLISKIYLQIQNDKDLFQLITKILIFDAAHFQDLDEMMRYFEFGYDWLQHQGSENICIHDFNLIFMRIITIFNNILFECKNEEILNISTDIVTSISLHFSTSMDQYSEHKTITNIFNQINIFYINSLEIDVGNVQFHSVQNITLFLNSIVLCSNKLKEIDYILTLIDQLFKLSFSSHFTNITDLCLCTICNFYYEINNNDTITIEIDDEELILKYATKMMQNPDYKIRRWSGLLLYFRFYFNNSTNHNGNTKYGAIYQQLLLDFDEEVSKPLLTLLEIETPQQITQYIESANILHPPNAALTANLQNDVLIEGRSDTVSINQARLKNDDDDDDINDDIDDIDDEDIINDIMEENKENNKLLSNLIIINDDASSTSTTSSSSQSMSPSSAESDDNMEPIKKSKINIPLLPLDQIAVNQIQTNIPKRQDINDIEDDEDGEQQQEVDPRGTDADDEREESIENIEKTPDDDDDNSDDVVIQTNNDNTENINFERGTNDDDDDDDEENPMDLEYIDSFLQSISVSTDILDTNDIAIDVDDANDKQQTLNDEQFEEFKGSNLNDFLVNVPRVKNRKNGWWMKYLNSDVASSDSS